MRSYSSLILLDFSRGGLVNRDHGKVMLVDSKNTVLILSKYPKRLLRSLI